MDYSENPTIDLRHTQNIQEYYFDPNYTLENLFRYEITSKTNTLLHFSI